MREGLFVCLLTFCPETFSKWHVLSFLICFKILCVGICAGMYFSIYYYKEQITHFLLLNILTTFPLLIHLSYLNWMRCYFEEFWNLATSFTSHMGMRQAFFPSHFLQLAENASCIKLAPFPCEAQGNVTPFRRELQLPKVISQQGNSGPELFKGLKANRFISVWAFVDQNLFIQI